MDILRRSRLHNNKGEDIIYEPTGKVTALYFSASWCPASCKFTSILKDLHGELAKRNSPFEVIYASFDKSEDDMMENISNNHGNWLSLGFGDEAISELQKQFGVELIPKLLVLRDDGSSITTNGRKDVQDKGIAAFRVWQDAARLSKKTAPIIT